MALAVTVGALVKSVTGMGLPPVAIPVLALFVGLRDAIIIMTLSTIVTNAFQMWTYRDAAAEARHLPRMVAAGVVATPVGVYFLTALDPTAVGLVLAVTVLLYIGFSLWKPELSVTDEVGRRAVVPVGVAGGALHGATGLSAVILASYLHATRLPPRAFLFSVSTLFGVFALVQVAGLVVAGAYLAHYGWYERLVREGRAGDSAAVDTVKSEIAQRSRETAMCPRNLFVPFAQWRSGGP